MRGTTSRRAGRRGQARTVEAAPAREEQERGPAVDPSTAAATLARIMAKSPSHAAADVAVGAALVEALPLIGRRFAIVLGADGRAVATAAVGGGPITQRDHDAGRAAAAAALLGATTLDAEVSALPLRAGGKIVGALAVQAGRNTDSSGLAQALDLLADCLGELLNRAPSTARGGAPAPDRRATDRQGVSDRLIDGLAGHDDGVALFGPDDGLIAANPAFAAAHGAKVRELKGLTLEEILRRNHDGFGPLLLGKDLRRRGAAGVELALAADGRWLRLSRRRSAAGDEMVLQIPADDVILGVMNARRGALAGQDADEARADIWDGIAVGAVLLSTTGRIVDANAEAERLLRTSRSELLGRRLGRVEAEGEADWARIGRAGAGAGDLAAKARRLADGRTLLAVVELPASAPAGAVEDVHVKRALAATEALGELGHEMRTPLNAVIGFSDIMLARSFGPINDRQAQYLADIGSAGRHMLEMVDHMFEHAQLTSGRYPFNPAWIDVAELAREAARLLEPSAADGEVALSVVAASDLEGFVDRRALLQALINLLTNAVKFTPPKGKVELAVDADESGLYFTVADTGEGIPDSDLQRVIEPFTQARRLGGRPLKGAGLGLSIVRALAELHDGSVAIASKLGQGTEVTIQLPATRFRSKRTDAT